MPVNNMKKVTLGGGKKVKAPAKKINNQGLVAPAKFGAVAPVKKNVKKSKQKLSAGKKKAKRHGTVEKLSDIA